jgi:methylphosphotriester-DNA--protein-cysteine methyltransferase
VTYTLIGRDGESRRGAKPGKFGGHRKSKIYGRLDCRAALRAIDRGGYVTHRVFFATAADAVAAGYRPCAVCLPGAYQTWKARQLKSRRAG